MWKRSVYAGLLAVCLSATPPLAAEQNFNTTAYKDGTTTGATNADCSSAIAWWCDAVVSADTTQAVPGPAIGWVSVIGVLVGAGFMASRRR